MARIIISTAGSSGDINPFIALGKELHARGHQLVFAVPEQMAATATGEGFPVHILPTPTVEDEQRYAQEVYGRPSLLGSMKGAAQKSLLPSLRGHIEALRVACKDADLLIAASTHIPASFVADLTGIPWASVALTPLLIPSASIEPYPHTLPIPGPIHRFTTRVSWAVGSMLLRQLADRDINALRASYGLPPRRDFLLDGNSSTTFTAVTTSPAFVPRPPDWPDYVHLTGFCFWDKPTAWREPEALRAFFAGDQPVIAASSGSQAPEAGQVFGDFYRTSIAAIRKAGARALVIGASPDALPSPLPPDVIALPFAPFSAIYPHCAAVIHHGGIGTTAQALRAGVPMLIVPWGFDQFFSGAQITRIGAGRWMRRPTYTVERATNALSKLLQQSRYRSRTQAIAAQIAHEDGIGAFCDQLEATMLHTEANSP